MKKPLLLIVFSIMYSIAFSQHENKQVPLSEFNLANNTSPAFVLINESPSEVYVPENLKALTIHALNNFDGSLSVEISPYYFINTKSMGRTFFTYLGIKKTGDTYKQNPFSGINTTTFSFAYSNKEFENFSTDKRKVFSFGLRTKFLRFYNTNEVQTYYHKISKVLTAILMNLPDDIEDKILQFSDDEEKKTAILNEYLNTKKAIELLKEKDLYTKPLKPVFQMDGAIGYSALFKENTISSATLNRFGAWITSELSLIFNKDSKTSKSNNYLNAFVIARYIEDGFNIQNKKVTYRDLGGKLELEFGKFSLGYEYIKRNGGNYNTRSVGNVKYLVNKNISLNGGFGKDFNSDENLVALFGINWGLNFDDN